MTGLSVLKRWENRNVLSLEERWEVSQLDQEYMRVASNDTMSPEETASACRELLPKFHRYGGYLSEANVHAKLAHPKERLRRQRP